MWFMSHKIALLAFILLLRSAAPPASVFLQFDSDGNGVLDQTRSLHHAVNAGNEIVSVTDDPFGEPGSGTTALVHDAAGNLVFDGVYVYQYDALNRLVQVNQPQPGGVTFSPEWRMSGDLLAVHEQIVSHRRQSPLASHTDSEARQQVPQDARQCGR